MRPTLPIVLVLALVLVVPACSNEPAEAVCEQPVAASEVELADFEFRPACVEASAGDTLALANTGGAPHTYTVNDTELHANLDAGETAELPLGDLAPGAYHVVCTYHPQMVGALKIV